MTSVRYGQAPGGPRGRRWKALSLALARSADEPWWWRHVDHDGLAFDLEYALIVDPQGRPPSPTSMRFWRMAWHILAVLWRARRDGYTFIFTGENDWTTFIVAGVQTLTGSRRPHHVVQQFIMREKTASLASRLKYAVMRWCFRSLGLVICSSRPELEYYRRVFDWPADKLAFVPFHADPRVLEIPVSDPPTGGYAIAAGRTFRDYDTLIEAFRGLDLPLTIVGYKGPLAGDQVPPNITLIRELPLAELTARVAASSVVIVPLLDLQISTGQSVFLQAMAMQKAVIVTAVNGPVDYIEHMKTGLLVPPRDPQALREAAQRLMGDPELRRQLAAAAVNQVKRVHLVRHYLEGVSRALEHRWSAL